MEHSNPLKNRSVCVTGGTGFIGSHLSRRMVGQGARVSIITEDKTSPELIKDILENVDIYHCDITDFISLNKVINEVKPDLVYHLAAKIDVSPGYEIIDSLININLRGTTNMLRASAEAKSVKRFVFISTSDVYGAADEPCSEDAPLNPVSPYGASKAAAELFVRQCGIPWVILRPFIVYGGGQSAGMFIPQLILSALKGEDFPMTGGEQTRDFLYIDDFTDACIKAGERMEAVGETINIASGKETPLAEVADNVMSLLDHPSKTRLGAIPYRKNERWHVRADTKKAVRLLGWSHVTGLTEGLKKTVHWYNNQKERCDE